MGLKQVCLVCCGQNFFSFNFLDQKRTHDLEPNPKSPDRPKSQTHHVVLWVKWSQNSEEMVGNEQIKSPLNTDNKNLKQTGLRIQASIQMFCTLLYKNGCCGVWLHDQQLLASIMFVCSGTYVHGYLYISVWGIAPVTPSPILYLFSTQCRV